MKYGDLGIRYGGCRGEGSGWELGLGQYMEWYGSIEFSGPNGTREADDLQPQL